LSLDRFKIESQQDLVDRTGTVAQDWAQGGSGEQIQGGLSSSVDILEFLPKGAFTALFRPLPGEIPSAFGILASVENVILLWLLGLGLFRKGFLQLAKDPLLQWAAVTVFVWSMVYGIISYQNLGTAVRFKLQIEPLLLLVLVQLARRRPTIKSAGRGVRNLSARGYPDLIPNNSRPPVA
jgi:hypothetical protein